jgi:hypothetical protein
MALPPYPDSDMHGNHRAVPPPENYADYSTTPDDPSSVSYIPLAARSVPQALTVHTTHVKKITYPMTSRLPELWVLERNQDGLETWRSIETFLGNLQLSQDPIYVQLQINGAFTTKFLRSPHHFIQSGFIQCFLILNTRMCTLDNQFRSSRITPTSSNHVGDDLHTIILKVLLFRYTGLHPVLTSRITIQVALRTEYSYTLGTDIGVQFS